MKFFRRFNLLTLFGISLLTWWGLDRLEPRAHWLQVVAPPAVESGRPLHLQVHLVQPQPARFLTADLHWARIHDHSEGYLATGGAQSVRPESGTYDFVIDVKSRPGLRFVRIVLYLSRDGNWESRTQVAGSEPLEVLPRYSAKSESIPVPLHMTSSARRQGVHSPASSVPRFVTGLVFLVAGALAWKHSRLPVHRLVADPERPQRGAGLAAVLVLAALWEFSFAESRIPELIRGFAHAGDWYYLRGPFQKIAISLVVGLLLAFIPRLSRFRGPQRVVFGTLLFYIGVSAVNMVSLHAIDQVADLSWNGVTAIQAVKLACAAVVVQRVAIMSRPGS
ncbi:MAG TPA: hypothetical protein VHI52_15885 [Verrucomicrobiae bacterium]|nr:hypothetical protein [Verrucomicrobiae bacterium]